jgi:SAM-dependent methyltransferase
MMDQCTGTLMSIDTGSEGDMPRLRTAAIMLGGAAAAVAIVQHNRGSVGLHAPGGIVMADAARYDSLTGVLLGSFYDSVADNVAADAASGGRVLDVGCGPGHLANRLAREHGLDVTGLDLDPAMIERARANAERAVTPEHRPTFVVGSVAALPFADASFDLVVSTLSMHHWADATAGQAEIGRVLRPGRRALIWDIRAGVVPLHRHQPDPLGRVAGSSLRLASATPWRWPWRLSFTQRIELASADEAAAS